MRRFPRVLDASAIIALFGGHPKLDAYLNEAMAGRWALVLPAACVAEAEVVLRAGVSGWEAIWLTSGVMGVDLSPGVAIEVGAWQGSLQARQAAWEHAHSRAMVVTTDPGQYAGLPVALVVV